MRACDRASQRGASAHKTAAAPERRVSDARQHAPHSKTHEPDTRKQVSRHYMENPPQLQAPLQTCLQPCDLSSSPSSSSSSSPPLLSSRCSPCSCSSSTPSSSPPRTAVQVHLAHDTGDSQDIPPLPSCPPLLLSGSSLDLHGTSTALTSSHGEVLSLGSRQRNHFFLSVPRTHRFSRSWVLPTPPAFGRRLTLLFLGGPRPSPLRSAGSLYAALTLLLL